MPEEAIAAPGEAQDQPEPVESPEEAPAPEVPVPDAGPVDADQPEADTPEGGVEDYFSPNFKPDELPDELKPAHAQMKADYTRKTQEVGRIRAEAEQATQIAQALANPKALPQILEAYGYTREQVLEAMGYEVEGGSDYGDDLDDPNPYDNGVVQELQGRLSAIEQQRAQELENQFILSQIGAVEDEAGREFSDQEFDFITDFAQRNRLPNGQPDIQGGYARLTELEAGITKRVIGPKKQAPRPVSTGGSVATPSERPDLTNRDVRLAKALEIAQAMSDDS